MENIFKQLEQIGPEAGKSRRVTLKQIRVDTSSMIKLCKYMMRDDSIRCIFIEACVISKVDLMILFECIPNTSIENLTLRRLSITESDMPVIVKMLQESNIQVFDLCDNLIGNEGADWLAYALKDCAVKELIIQGCRITRIGALCNVIGSGVTNIRVLNISHNHIAAGEGRHIAAMLKGNHSIANLFLNNMNLEPKCWQAIFQQVANCPGIAEFCISKNNIRNPECIASIVEMLKSKTCRLQTLYLAMTDMDGPTLMELSKGIKQALHLKCLGFGKNYRIRDTDMEEFKKTIGFPVNLRVIDLRESGCTDLCQQRMYEFTKRLHGERSQTMITLVSAFKYPRIGAKSIFSKMPFDLIRSIADYLPCV